MKWPRRAAKPVPEPAGERALRTVSEALQELRATTAQVRARLEEEPHGHG